MNLNRINILFIIKSHLSAVKDSLPVFVLLPIVLAVVLCWQEFYLKPEVTSIVITSLSIFIALFFNVNIVLLNLKHRIGNNRDRKIAFEETHNCISFLIVVGLLGIISCYGALSSYFWIKVISNFLAYFILGVFFLTVVMALKNVHIIFEDDLTRGDS